MSVPAGTRGRCASPIASGQWRKAANVFRTAPDVVVSALRSEGLARVAVASASDGRVELFGSSTG